MNLGARFGLVLAAVLIMSGCAPAANQASPPPSDSATTQQTVTPTPTPTPTVVAPEDVDPASFLLDGTPGVLDSDGFWKGHYGFFTDETTTVRCDVWIFSGDSGGVTCGAMPGSFPQVTYTLPTANCDASTSNPTDGYSVGINFKVFESGLAGFTGCHYTANVDPTLVAATHVLHDNQTLHVDSDGEKYTCTVAAGVASCAESISRASIQYGLGVASFRG